MYRVARATMLACLLSACGAQSPEQAVVSARASIEKGKFSDAAILLKSALAQQPNLAEARLLLGTTLLNVGDIGGALIEFQKANELGISADRLHPLMAKTLLVAGQPDKVIAQFDGSSVTTPEAKAELFGYLAAANLAKGQREAADKWVSQALVQDARQLDALLVRVKSLSAQGKTEAAEQALDEVLKLHPQSSRALQLRGDMLLARGDREGAKKAYGSAVSAEAKNFTARTSLILALLADRQLDAADRQLGEMRKLTPNHPRVRYLSALIALERGNLNAALEDAQAFLKANPDDPSGLRLVGSIAMVQGRTELASASFAKAVSLVPDDAEARLSLARAQLEAGDGSGVVKSLLPAGTNKESLSWEAASLLGQAYMQLRDNDKAEVYFRAAAKLNPRDLQSRTALALAAINRGNLVEGLADLRALAAADSNGRVADMALVNVLLQRKDFEQAAKAVQALEAKQPDSPFGFFLQGVVEQQRGTPADARRSFESVLVKWPGYFPALSALASLEVHEGQTPQARQRVEAFLSKNPKDVQAGMLLAQVLGAEAAETNSPEVRQKLVAHFAALAKAHPDDAAIRVAQIVDLIEAKELRKAKEAAQDALTALPGRADLLDLLARIQNRLGDGAQAIETYNKSIAANPTLPEVHVRVAELYIEQKNLAAAAQSLRKALQIKEDYLPALKRSYELEVARGDLAASLKVARQAQNIRSELADGWVWEADALARKGDQAAAVGVMKRALAKNDDGELAALTHRLMLSAKSNDEARKFEMDWLTRHPRDVQFRNYLLNNALLRRDYPSAERLAAEVIKIKPDHAGALNNLAWLKIQAGKPEGLNLALRAVAAAPRRPEYLDTLAQAYLLGGKLDLALLMQKKAVALAPDNQLHRVNLVRVYMANGKFSEAKAELNLVKQTAGALLDSPDFKQLEAELSKK